MGLLDNSLLFCDPKELYELLDKREKSADPLEGGSILPFFGQLRLITKEDKESDDTPTHMDFSDNTVFATISSGPTSRIRAFPFDDLKGQQSYFDWPLTEIVSTKMLHETVSKEIGSYFDPKTKILYKCFFTIYTTNIEGEFLSVRNFFLAAIHWNNKTHQFKVVAHSMLRANDMALLTLPVSTAQRQVRPIYRETNFVKGRRQVFALLAPAADIYNCLLVYVCWKGEFVPVAGNYKDYPGLHVFPTDTFFVQSRNYSKKKQGLFLGKILPRNTEGYAEYELSRICLLW